MKKKVWNITVKDNPNRVGMGENDEFYTTDSEAYLVFKLDDENFNPATAVLTLENRNDGSLKNETVDVVDGLIEWEMPQRYIEHFGNWQGQLVYEDTKDGQPELYTSAQFTFVVNAHIGDKKKPSLVEIENWEKFIREGTELIETWEDMEDLRQANEAQRQANYQELLDTGVLQTNINSKIEALEEEYAPKLTEVAAQLAQTERAYSENKPSTYRHRDKRPVVTFLDDDGKKEVFTKLRPIFNDKNVPLSMAIITGRLDNREDTMTSDEVKTMIAEGHEALGHTHDAHSPDMTTVSEEYLINDLIENRKQLAMLGSDSRGFVYPGGKAPKWVREITQNHFDFSFGATGINHDDNIDPMVIKRVGFGRWGSGANLEKYKSDVDEVIDSGGWLVFMLHVGTGDTPEEELAILPDLIDYIKSRDIEIVNASEGYEIHGSKIFIGDKEGKYLNITNNAIHGNFELDLDSDGYTITQLPPDAKSSEVGFFDYPEGQTIFRVTADTALSDGGLPENRPGVLTTYRYTLSQGYNYQEYKLYNYNTTYTRYATGNFEWGQWVKNTNENDLPIITEEPNSRVNDDRPADYPDNKITYTELFSDEHMLEAGFPTTTKCVLITDRISGNYYSIRQELRRIATNDTWIRTSIGASGWRDWVKVNTTVVQ